MIDKYNEEFNKSVKLTMNEIIQNKFGNKTSPAKIARRLSYQYIKNLMGEELKELNEKGGNKIKPTDIEMYYIANGTSDDTIQYIKLSDNTFVKLEFFIPYKKMVKYLSLNENTKVPTGVIALFCQHFNIKLEDFMDKIFEKQHLQYQKFETIPENNKTTDNDSHAMAYLKSIFKEDDNLYAFDTEKHKYLFAELFDGNSPESIFHTVHISLNKPQESKKDSGCKKGTIKFFRGEDNVCRTQLVVETAQGSEHIYDGIVILANAGTDKGIAWCFTKRRGIPSELIIMAFRLGDNKNMVKMAIVISIKSNSGTPVVFRMLMSKNPKYIDAKNLIYFKGHLKFNTKSIIIQKDYFDNALRYFAGGYYKIEREKIGDLSKIFLNKAILDDILEHFLVPVFTEEKYEQIKKVIADIKPDELEGNYYKIDYEKEVNGIKYIDILKGNPLLLSWLRKHSVGVADNNGLHSELDEYLNVICKLIEELEEREKNEEYVKIFNPKNS